MAFAPVLLNSVTVAAADSTRASPDYIVGHGTPTNGQWAIGNDAMWHWALGLRPFKDTFYTNTSEFVTNPKINIYRAREGCPVLHAFMATLSTAPVAISDGVGSANQTLVTQLVRSDGLVLRPDRPVTATDMQVRSQVFGGGPAPSGAIYTTHTAIGGYHWMFVATVSLSDSYDMSPDVLALKPPETKSMAAFRFDFGAAHRPSLLMPVFDAAHPLPLEKGQHACDISSYWIVAPVFSNGLVLMGEVSKLVPISRSRIVAFAESSDEIIVTVSGAENELVELGFFNTTARVPQADYLTCTVPSIGSVVMHLVSKKCTPAN